MLTNTNALMSRIVLADAARHSIDLQYYIWNDDLVGHQLGDRCHVVDAHLLDRVQDADRAGIADQLQEVPVARHDVDGHLTPQERRQGADDVIGLVAVDADPGDAEGHERVDDDRHLHRQCVRHGLAIELLVAGPGDAVGLVGRDRLDAEGGSPVVVPAGDEVARTAPLGERGDHVEEAPDGVGRHAARPDDLGHPEEGAEVERRGVEEQGPLVRHPPRLPMDGPDGPP